MSERIITQDGGHILLWLRCGRLLVLFRLRHGEPCESLAQDVRLGRGQAFLQAPAGCARLLYLVLPTEGRTYAGTLLRGVITSASQRRSCLRAVNRTHSHAWSAGLRNTIHLSGIIGPLYCQRSPAAKEMSMRAGEAAFV